MKTADMNLMKQINRNILRSVMKQCKRATKPQMARLTGLSIVTVGSLVEELVQNGELLSGQQECSSGGRPAILYEFNSEHSTAIILYSGEAGEKDVLHFAVIDLFGEVLIESDLYDSLIDVSNIQKEIERLLILYPFTQIIGIGLPGQETNGVLNIMDYENLRGTKLIKNLQDTFELPVFFENDVNVAVFGNYVHNQLEEKNVIGVYLPEKYPLGVGMMLNGKVYKGRDGLAGEMADSIGVTNWKDVGYVNVHLKETLTSLIHNLTCLLNPHKIIVYRENLKDSDLQDWMNELKGQFPDIPYSEVIQSHQFHLDFSIGMKAKAIEELEKRYQKAGDLR